jgi:hypothetical protein
LFRGVLGTRKIAENQEKDNQSEYNQSEYNQSEYNQSKYYGEAVTGGYNQDDCQGYSQDSFLLGQWIVPEVYESLSYGEYCKGESVFPWSSQLPIDIHDQDVHQIDHLNFPSSDPGFQKLQQSSTTPISLPPVQNPDTHYPELFHIGYISPTIVLPDPGRSATPASLSAAVHTAESTPSLSATHSPSAPSFTPKPHRFTHNRFELNTRTRRLFKKPQVNNIYGRKGTLRCAPCRKHQQKVSVPQYLLPLTIVVRSGWWRGLSTV